MEFIEIMALIVVVFMLAVLLALFMIFEKLKELNHDIKYTNSNPPIEYNFKHHNIITIKACIPSCGLDVKDTYIKHQMIINMIDQLSQHIEVFPLDTYDKNSSYIGMPRVLKARVPNETRK